jgi:ABC-type nickel/cobalt efflux system permease component RcnA
MIRTVGAAIVLILLALGLAMQWDGAKAQDAGQSAQPSRPAWPSAAPGQGAPKSAFPSRAPGQSPPAPGHGEGWWGFVLDMQQTFKDKIVQSVKALKTGETFSGSFLLVAVSFLYGVFHAAGPGHGKAVISSYVLANGATVRRGIILSFLAAIVQAISAIAVISVFAIMLKAAGIQINQMVQRFETASGVLIALTGLMLLTVYLRGRLFPAPAHDHAGHHHDHDHHHHEHGEDCGCGHAHMPDPRDLSRNWSLRHAAAIVFAIGIRPCTGAILVLAFALTQGLFWAGVGATFAMALGTAITVSILAVAAVGSRDLALRFAGSRWTAGIYDIAAVGGSLLVVVMGAALFWSSLGPVKPF